MHRIVIGLLAAGCLFASQAHAIYLPKEEPRVVINDLYDRDIVSETDHYCMTLAIFFEGGSTGEPETGMRHIARVIAERAKANRREWGGSTICGVVFYRKTTVCQFSFACLPLARRAPRPGPGWDASAQIAREQLEGKNEEPSRLIRYYMNAPLANPRSACNFRKEFVRVTTAGRHEFFREATSAERRELERQNHHDCYRYAKSLKKSKDKVKRFAKLHSKKKRYAAKAGRRG